MIEEDERERRGRTENLHKQFLFSVWYVSLYKCVEIVTKIRVKSNESEQQTQKKINMTT